MPTGKAPDPSTQPEEWGYWKATNESDAATVKSLVGLMAKDYLRSYADTGDPVHFFRAWLALRKTGATIPASLLQEVDALATQFVLKQAPRPRGADAYAQRRALMQEVWDAAFKHTGLDPGRGVRPTVPDEVMRAVAERHGMTFENLKVQWGEWHRKRTRTKRADAGADLASVWSSPKR